MDIISAYTSAQKNLRQDVGSSSNPVSSLIAQRLKDAINGHMKNSMSLFTTSDCPALVDPANNRILTHRELFRFVQDFKLPLPPTKRPHKKPTVVLALPNGFTLGLACLAVTSYYTAAPINISGGSIQLKSDVEIIQPDAILVRLEDIKKLGLDGEWVARSDIKLIALEEDSKSTFTVRSLSNIKGKQIEECRPNEALETALVLLTSGTSGTKKVVPLSTISLLIGTSCVITSWRLNPQDSCINMMPLNHVGGLVRNLFAPVFSGGSTILCTSFDPNLFWDLVVDGQGTWYYASPSMHTSILSERDLRNNSLMKTNIRLVCNAAGALLPALALRLRDAFNCTVLPSYGMTECMPISTPPLDYALDRPGTSGIPCGPEVAIMNKDYLPLPAGETGHIVIRGGPTFAGYLSNGEVTDDSFKNGWFDTGDLGYLDTDGYLFLTGRDKEVINRGGEIISPFEIEEAITVASHTPNSPLYQKLKAVMAFSVPHDVLQETVGVVIVPLHGKPRPDLRILHSSLSDLIHASKLPNFIVYMEALPTNNNKIIRIGLSERMRLKSIGDNTKFIEKHYEAICPPPNSSLDTLIDSTMCFINVQLIQKTINEVLSSDFESITRLQPESGLAEVLISPQKDYLPESDVKLQVSKHINNKLDSYHVPIEILVLHNPIPRNKLGLVDDIELQRLVNYETAKKYNRSNLSETQYKIISAISNVLNVPVHKVGPDSDFFQLGGDSLTAGRLLSSLRRDFQIQIPIHQLFACSVVWKLGELADKLSAAQVIMQKEKISHTEADPKQTKMHSSKNPVLLIINLLPIILFYPMKLAFWFTMFIYSLSYLSNYWRVTNLATRFVILITAMSISSLSSKVATPIFGILFKWVIIGRFKAGIYPMWGAYHTRWWVVSKMLLVCGKGLFRYSNVSRLLYYRALGARIGRNVVVEDSTDLGEYDLLDIGDNVHLDKCICRPFACEKNTTMFLGKIHIGQNSSVGLKSYVAAGSIVPSNSYIGPNSSSYEKDDATQDSRCKTNGKLPEPHFFQRIIFIYPLQLAVMFVANLPWMIALIGVVDSKPTGTAHHGIKTIIEWWADPHRIAYHYLAGFCHVIISPPVRFLCIVIIKHALDLLCGKSRSQSTQNFTSSEILRKGLMDALKPSKSLNKFTKLFGSHYEVTSIAARALGARVGKRVYWPGKGPFVQDFDLIDIGDDVVFGSRSHILTRDGYGLASVKIQSGAMVADRVVLNPGTLVGSRAILGSGTTSCRGQMFASDTVWIGKKNGRAVCLSHTKLDKTGHKHSGKQGKFSKDEKMIDMKDRFSNESEKRSTTYSMVSCNSLFYDIESKPVVKTSSNLHESELEGIITQLEDVRNTTSPFGRAFYEHQAPYHVFTLPIITLYSLLTTALNRIFWDSNILINLLLNQFLKYTNLLKRRPTRSFLIYGLNTGLLSVVLLFSSIFALFLVIATKWIIIGRRKPGNYDWDKSSYCQRWKLLLTIESLRTNCFGKHGILGMLTGTYYIVLYYRLLGANIGSNTALFAGGPSSAYITEPDLLFIGNRVAIDDASLVAHINSRGNFDLRTLEVANGAVLRSGSRLLSGASMGNESMLLEHSLIMAGDRADNGTIYQGWPADVYSGSRSQDDDFSKVLE